LEAVVRHLTATLIVIGAIGLSGAALARDIYLPKQTPEQIKAVCAKVGGNFSQDAHGYECGTDCHGKPGTACTVYCKPGQKCAVQVIGGRHPRTVESALVAPARHAR
jgi:hypothetical protein